MRMSAELTEALFTQAAGWDAVKRARAYLAQGHVLSSYWAPPLLRGVVQGGEISYRASMVIKSEVELENLCTCRDSRQWGKICAHVVAVGLHWLDAQKPKADLASSTSSTSKIPAKKAILAPARCRWRTGGVVLHSAAEF